MRISDWSSDVCSSDLKLRAAGELDRARIDGASVAVKLVMQVRAGRHAGRSDIADDLALLDPLPCRHLEPAHMRIGGGKAVAVADLHIFAIAPVSTGDFDAPRRCGKDRRAMRCNAIPALLDAGIAAQGARQRVVSGKSESVHVNLGGGRIIKTKHNT